MNLDILISVAFGIFIVLLVWRMRERLKENSENQNYKVNEEESGWASFRKWWMIVQLIVLCGLLFYMVPLLWKDFQSLEERNCMQVVLRCLVFIFTIYILFVRIGKRLKVYWVNTK